MFAQKTARSFTCRIALAVLLLVYVLPMFSAEASGAETTTSVTPSTVTSSTYVAPDQPIQFQDSVLQSKLESLLKKSGITPNDMATLTGELDLYSDGPGGIITSLNGLQYAVNVTYIRLGGNDITDLSPLANLTQLNNIELRWNPNLSDLSPLSGLVNLTELDIDTCKISDLSPLHNMTQMQTLYTSDNQLTNLQGLENMTHLQTLEAQDNQIQDISALAGLTGFTDLRLYGNRISDISAVQNMAGLTTLYIYENRIEDITPLQNLLAVHPSLASSLWLDFSNNPIDYGNSKQSAAVAAINAAYPGNSYNLSYGNNANVAIQGFSGLTEEVASNVTLHTHVYDGRYGASTDSFQHRLEVLWNGQPADPSKVTVTVGGTTLPLVPGGDLLGGTFSIGTNPELTTTGLSLPIQIIPHVSGNFTLSDTIVDAAANTEVTYTASANVLPSIGGVNLYNPNPNTYNDTSAVNGTVTWWTYSPLPAGETFRIGFYDNNDGFLEAIAPNLSADQTSYNLANLTRPAAATRLGVDIMNGSTVVAGKTMPIYYPSWYDPILLTVRDSNSAGGEIAPEITWNGLRDESHISVYRIYYETKPIGTAAQSRIKVADIQAQGNGTTYRYPMSKLPADAFAFLVEGVSLHGDEVSSIVASYLFDDSSADDPTGTVPTSSVLPVPNGVNVPSENAGTLSGQIGWSIEPNAAVTGYRLYFTDDNGAKVKQIGTMYFPSNSTIGYLNLPVPLTIPDRATRVAVYSIDSSGAESTAAGSASFVPPPTPVIVLQDQNGDGILDISDVIREWGHITVLSRDQLLELMTQLPPNISHSQPSN